MMNPEENMDMPMEAPAEGAPAPEAEESKFDMEMMVGNMLDLPENERKIASKLILSPMATILDKIVGEPVFTRMNNAIGSADKATEAPEEAPAEGGMMAPTEEEMPAETPAEPLLDMPEEEEAK